MLRIEKAADGCVITLRLGGRIQSDRIACIRSAMNEDYARPIFAPQTSPRWTSRKAPSQAH